ncbi:hypothetical protein HYZ98_04095 [Candidatus Peregrinibacteria bacterium]|nr:hypothetical protein [Candidatus Peregrinibacteria bacterium]
MMHAQWSAYKISKRLTYILGAANVGMIAYALILAHPSSAEARILPHQKGPTQWEFIEPEQIEQGATIPANTHTVIHLPFNFRRIARDVLLGNSGERVRYWGYCLPENYPSETVAARTGLPGKLFLSEAERTYREEQEQAKKPSFSIHRLPTKKDLQKQRRTPMLIRHEVEMFTPGLLCYIMTQEPLSIGLDADNDLFNTKMEKNIGTDPESPDTDRDGIWDGVEYLTQTTPLIRDTDNDGLIDGLEDKNWNGIVESGETDPRKKDTDRDGLCDGLCRVRLGSGQEALLGEDLNLNGILDDGETDPLKEDTNGDGILDFAAYIQCQIGQSTTCPKK